MSSLSTASIFIFKQFLDLKKSLNQNLEVYELAHSVEELYDFLWNDFADWYIEYLKTDPTQIDFAKDLFRQFVMILYPYNPFLCEFLWTKFFQATESLGFEILDENWSQKIIAKYNLSSHQITQAIVDFNLIKEVVINLRSIRGLFQISFQKPMIVYSTSDILLTNQPYIEFLSKTTIQPLKQTNFYTYQTQDYNFSIDILSYLNDLESEIQRTKKLLSKLDSQIQVQEKQLQNPQFLDKADTTIIAKKRTDLENLIQEKDLNQKKLKYLQKESTNF